MCTCVRGGQSRKYPYMKGPKFYTTTPYMCTYVVVIRDVTLCTGSALTFVPQNPNMCTSVHVCVCVCVCVCVWWYSELYKPIQNRACTKAPKGNL